MPGGAFSARPRRGVSRSDADKLRGRAGRPAAAPCGATPVISCACQRVCVRPAARGSRRQAAASLNGVAVLLAPKVATVCGGELRKVREAAAAEGAEAVAGVTEMVDALDKLIGMLQVYGRGLRVWTSYASPRTHTQGGGQEWPAPAARGTPTWVACTNFGLRFPMSLGKCFNSGVEVKRSDEAGRSLLYRAASLGAFMVCC